MRRRGIMLTSLREPTADLRVSREYSPLENIVRGDRNMAMISFARSLCSVADDLV
jgi:hypothetical protein